ncbi:MAG: ASKHA domain-containing protein [Acidobacteriota bacterium]
MPNVRFLPADVAVEVASGTLLHEAAARAGVADLELPCGGQGSCGQCLVDLVDGDGAATSVLACRTQVESDLTVRLPEHRDTAMQVVGDSRFLASDGVLPDRASLSPLWRYVPLTVPPASIDEHHSDWKRLLRELPAMPVHTSPHVLAGLAEALRADEGRITVGLAEHGSTLRLVEVIPGHAPPRAFGLAIDIGTTTVAVQLVDLDDGRVLSTGTAYNRQLRRGADVITRIDYARTPERSAELRQLALETINALLAELTTGTHVEPGEIRAAFIAGNTTMVHLLLGLPPRYIREAPYVPTVNPVPPLTASEVGLDIAPEAAVAFAPGVGSYVGGDITAGVLSTALPASRDEVCLFLDIGTNGEIVLGNADWMVACACSAGPAFEGSGIRCGMRAAAGAIESIELGERGRTVRYSVIGGGKPEGLCGSGLICLAGELFRTGVIDAAGHFNPDPGNPRLTGSAFVVEGDIAITEADLENLIRTKAAIYAACRLILENVGLTWDDVARVFIAGGFGRYIRISEAIAIGMLPDLPHGRFSYIGNSALTGAYIALLSADYRRKLAETAARITYVDLSSEPRYMDSYVKAMFLPHTDLSEFSRRTQ